MDGIGAAALVGFASLLAFNQVVIKLTGEGFGPVFQAGLRSVLGLGVLGLWIALRRVDLQLPAGAFFWGVVSGLLFAFEFVCLYLALDLTTVSRASVIFYSMPVWLGLAAHLWLPGERLSGRRMLGLGLALAGVALALLWRGQGAASLLGDVLALVATLAWAGIALVVRMTPQSRVSPELQLLFQLAVSAPVLLLLAPLFGDLLRDPGPLHLAGLAFQSVCVVSLGFLLWFRLMAIYRASSVASFSFLSPVLAVILGWLILGESAGPQVWAALGLVAGGVFLINRR